jgi:hypothetical protein
MYIHGANLHQTNDPAAICRSLITELRRDLGDTLTLIERLSDVCQNIEDKLATVEQEYTALLQSE